MIKNYIKNLFSRNIINEEKKKSGDKGEELASRFLKRQGYEILIRNFRTRFGEIDIVANDKETLCFVEVKARSNMSYGLPEEFVDKRKQEKLVKTALVYINKNCLDSKDMRFDIVSVDLSKESCKLIQNAFEVNL